MRKQIQEDERYMDETEIACEQLRRHMHIVECPRLSFRCYEAARIRVTFAPSLYEVNIAHKPSPATSCGRSRSAFS